MSIEGKVSLDQLKKQFLISFLTHNHFSQGLGSSTETAAKSRTNYKSRWMDTRIKFFHSICLPGFMSTPSDGHWPTEAQSSQLKRRYPSKRPMSICEHQQHLSPHGRTEPTWVSSRHSISPDEAPIERCVVCQ